MAFLLPLVAEAAAPLAEAVLPEIAEAVLPEVGSLIGGAAESAATGAAESAATGAAESAATGAAESAATGAAESATGTAETSSSSTAQNILSNVAQMPMPSSNSTNNGAQNDPTTAAAQAWAYHSQPGGFLSPAQGLSPQAATLASNQLYETGYSGPNATEVFKNLSSHPSLQQGDQQIASSASNYYQNMMANQVGGNNNVNLVLSSNN